MVDVRGVLELLFRFRRAFGRGDMSVRFGIALPKELAEELESIAKSMGVTRSKVIEIAIRSFLNYLKAINDPEKAKMFVVISKKENASTILGKMEDIEDLSALADGDKVILIIRAKDGKSLFKRLSKVKCSIYPISLPG